MVVCVCGNDLAERRLCLVRNAIVRSLTMLAPAKSFGLPLVVVECYFLALMSGTVTGARPGNIRLDR